MAQDELDATRFVKKIAKKQSGARRRLDSRSLCARFILDKVAMERIMLAGNFSFAAQG